MASLFTQLALRPRKNPSSPSTAIFQHVLSVRKQMEELKPDHTQYMVTALSAQYRKLVFFQLCLEHVWALSEMCELGELPSPSCECTDGCCSNSGPGMQHLALHSGSHWKKIQATEEERAIVHLEAHWRDFRSLLPHTA